MVERSSGSRSGNPRWRTASRTLSAFALVAVATIAEAQVPTLTVPIALTPSPSPTPPPATPTGPTPTRTAAGTSTPTRTSTGVTATPNPTATPGGTLKVSSAKDVNTTEGATVDAGDFEVHNTTSDLETVTEVTLTVSDPAIFASLSLTASIGGSSQAATVSSPQSTSTFGFDPGVRIPAGDTATFALSATMAGGSTSSATATSGTPSASGTPSPSPTQHASLSGRRPWLVASTILRRPGSHTGSELLQIGPPPRSLRAALTLSAALMLLVAISSSRRRRMRTASAAGLLALLAAGYAACGNDRESSAQTVTALSAANATNVVTFSGLPASLGSVSLPKPLKFPGGKK